MEEDTLKTKPLTESITPFMQRQAEEEEEELLQPKSKVGGTPQMTAAVADQIGALEGSGQPLPASERAFFEPRFGADFGQVRIHTGAEAVASAQAVNARAYTLGRNIVFARNQFAPGTDEGRRLNAHELAHVVQQKADNQSFDLTESAISKLRVLTLQRQSEKETSTPEELIAAHTNEWGLDETGLGNILSTLVLSSPLQIDFVSDVFDALDPNDRDEVAYAFIKDRSDDFITALAGFQNGRDFIERIGDEMKGGITLPWEKKQINRIDKIVRGIVPGTPPSAIAQEIVRKYQSAPPAERFPGGDCFEVTRERLEAATMAVLGEGLKSDLPEQTGADKLAPEKIFDLLFGSLIGRDCKDGGELMYKSATRNWLSIDEQYRGEGAAGAMAYAGKGRLVDQRGIWKWGDLTPGAIVQTWKKAGDFQRVKEGECPGSYGHSFIFFSYVRNDEEPDAPITGMRIMDQGYQGGIVLTEGEYEYWVAANIDFGPVEEKTTW